LDPDQRPTLSPKEVARFLVWLRTKNTGWKMIPGVALQGLCGLRLREGFRLKWEKVDLERGTVTIEGQVKNSHSVRRLPLPLLVWEILRQTSRQSSYVISGYNADINYSEAIKRALQGWRPEFRLEPKGFRRTLPSVGIREGWHKYALERYLGHSPKTSTERHYVSLDHDELENLLRKEVAERINSNLKPFLRVWQQKGKKKNTIFTQDESVNPN
jgi:integrase